MEGDGMGTAQRHLLGPPIGERKGWTGDDSRTGLAGMTAEQGWGAGLAEVELSGGASTR